MEVRRKPVLQDPPSNQLNDPATEECEKGIVNAANLMWFESPTPGDFSQEGGSPLKREGSVAAK
jgi:hypothetical protein